MAEESKESSSTRASVVPWLVLVALIGGAFWLGVKALQEAPEGGPAGPPPGGGGGGMPPATVIMAPVVQEDVQEFRRVTGTLRSVSRADVAAREAGAVEQVLVDEGDTVEKGAPMAEMDARRIEAEVAEAKALLTAAKAVVVQRDAEAKRAATDLDRKKELYEGPLKAVSEGELLDAERTKAVAEALQQAARDQLTAVESQLTLLEVRQNDLQIPAPFDGRVVMRHVDPGEWLNPGEPVVTLVSTGTIEAVLNVPERFAASINGGELQVTIEGLGRTVTASKTRRVADVDGATRLFPVVAELDDLDGALVPGMSVQAELPVGEKQRLLGVPADAVIETQTQAYVFRPMAAPESEGPPIAEKVSVQIRFRREGQTWLEPGALKEGNEVIVEGNERLFPGQPLIFGGGGGGEEGDGEEVESQPGAPDS